MEGSPKKLYRSRFDKVIWGVAGGLAKYFNIDSTIVRIVFIILALINGFGILLYLILAIAIPSEPEAQTEGNNKSAESPVEKMGEGVQSLADDVKTKLSNSSHVFGLILVLVGLILLTNILFPQVVRLDVVFAGLIIFTGLYLILKSAPK